MGARCVRYPDFPDMTIARPSPSSLIDLSFNVGKTIEFGEFEFSWVPDTYTDPQGESIRFREIHILFRRKLRLNPHIEEIN